MGQNYQTLYTGFEEVALEYHNGATWEPRDSEVAEMIEKTIEEKRKEAEKQGNEFYDGPLVRVRNSKLKDPDTLYLELENTSYFPHAATRDDESLSKENRADPLSVGARIRTNDNYIILGEKSSWSDTGSGEYQLAGAGFIEDPTTQYQRSLNAEPVSPINREIEEEVNLEPDQLEQATPTDLIGAVTYQPMLVYDTETSLYSEDIASEWAKIPNSEKEFASLAFLPEEDALEATEGEEAARFATTNEELEFELDEYKQEIPLRPHGQGALEKYF